MGSGETAPTMVKVHRSVLERLGERPVEAVLLGTPFGFQENAAEISQRVVQYFAESLGTEITVAGAREGSGPDTDAFAEERLVELLRDARYVFAGPGSPSYALRKWKRSVVPSLLGEKLEHGGAVTFSSAAALTLGLRTIPVYEIYKVGEDPYWLEGLDLLSVTGLRATVIPHYNNAEGGTHDTRFCYLGEGRLSLLEKELPEDSFVLGVDEHTALVLDLEAEAAAVAGNGVVTVRADGRSRSWQSGSTISFEELDAVAGELRRNETSSGPAPRAPSDAQAASDPLDGEPDGSLSSGGQYSGSPVLDIVRSKEASFKAGIEARDVKSAVEAILELDSGITAWSHDIPAGDALDRARASLRSLVVALGRTAEGGARDPRDVVGPFVDCLLDMRRTARAEGRFEDADEIRNRLLDLGVEIRDSPAGSTWLLRPR